MDIILYFAFGALNICLLYLITNIYNRKTGVDLLPGKLSNDKLETILNLIAYFVCGPFGTVVVFMLGITLFIMWFKFYRKKIRKIFGLSKYFFLYL